MPPGEPNPWEYLRQGLFEQGLAIIRVAHQQDKSASRIMQLGVACAWSGDYEAVWDHFQSAMVNHHHSIARFYGMAGVAKWCLGHIDTAIQWWQLGLSADYADGAGGIHLPLLLYAASVLRPGAFPRKEANNLLRKKVEDPRVANWPGPIGRFVLGRIDFPTLEHESQYRGMVHPQHKWLIDFYHAIVRVETADLEPVEFRKLLKHMTALDKPEWSDERNFLRLIWNDEFFIARCEASRPA